MAVKIKLTRLGKIRNPQYRIAVADARTRRDGRSIEVIGRYHPKEDPSLIEIDSERAQYWLGVGAQPTEPVLALLKITGDWQKFKGLPGAEGTLRTAEPKADKKAVFEAAAKDSAGTGGAKDGATTPKKRAAKKTAAAEAPAEAAAEAPADAPAEPAAEAPAEATVTEEPKTEPAAEAAAEAAPEAPAAESTDAAPAADES